MKEPDDDVSITDSALGTCSVVTGTTYVGAFQRHREVRNHSNIMYKVKQGVLIGEHICHSYHHIFWYETSDCMPLFCTVLRLDSMLHFNVSSTAQGKIWYL